MKQLITVLIASAVMMTMQAARGAGEVTSPDGKVSVVFSLTVDGAPRYTVSREGKVLLAESKLGVVREDADFSRGLTLVGEEAVEKVTDTYDLPTIKRVHNVYVANRKVIHLSGAGGRMDVVFQVSNDGVAFRYVFAETSAVVHALKAEATTFRFLPGTVAWLQPKAVARSGWSSANPSYEEYYEKGIAAGTPSTLGAGWVYPALFKSGETWILLSETAVGRGYCGTCLADKSPEGEYAVAFPDARETMTGGAVNPQSKLPWASPWRLIVVGSLGTIAESTLGTDLADKPAGDIDGTPMPRVDVRALVGKSSWSWPLKGDAGTNFETQKQFIDMAAGMGWKYCLIDALWDVQIGDEKIRQLVEYAAGKKVAICVWYNSAGDWNTTPQTPRDKMVTHASRVAEFERLKKLGVAGIKIDFFGGDGQSFMNYYQDILEDAAPYGFVMNFHGATLPRGWERTYPHLMTMEAIKGFEFVTFDQKNADEEPAHCTMLPFTRNVFDPMDFTPVCLDKINDKVKRRTTPAFELALSVLFTSGIQHYVETPEGMAAQPEYVQEFMKHVPSVWEEVKLLDGYPGKWVALARKAEGKWYVAVINGEQATKNVTLDLSALAVGKGKLIVDAQPTDGPSVPAPFFGTRDVDFSGQKKMELRLLPAGGAVMVLE